MEQVTDGKMDINLSPSFQYMLECIGKKVVQIMHCAVISTHSHKDISPHFLVEMDIGGKILTLTQL